jgi:dihydrofolate reductase
LVGGREPDDDVVQHLGRQNEFDLASAKILDSGVVIAICAQARPVTRGRICDRFPLQTERTSVVRKFKLQVQTSIDGYMASPNGEAGGMDVPFTEDVYAYMDALAESVDCIVLGRRTAEGFIPAWASRPEDEPQALIDWINSTPKVVISNTLTTSPWEDVVVAGGDIVETVNQLKAQPGGDLIAYGGGTLVSSLLANKLVDELYLFVNPIVFGGGMPVFGKHDINRRFRLIGAQAFDCGIVAIHYQPHAS